MTEELLCRCCGHHCSIAETTLLQAEADWLATGACNIHLLPSWSVEEARTGKLQWACVHCFEAGRALEGHPALQTWCDNNPYFAFFDVERQCEDCGQPFVFSAAEQQYW